MPHASFQVTVLVMLIRAPLLPIWSWCHRALAPWTMHPPAQTIILLNLTKLSCGNMRRRVLKHWKVLSWRQGHGKYSKLTTHSSFIYVMLVSNFVDHMYKSQSLLLRVFIVWTCGPYVLIHNLSDGDEQKPPPFVRCLQETWREWGYVTCINVISKFGYDQMNKFWQKSAIENMSKPSKFGSNKQT